MAFNTKTDASGRWTTVGKHAGKPVKFKVRTLSQTERDECNRAAFGKLKGRQLGRELAAKLVSRVEAETIERAIKELVDSENYTIRIVAADVDLYSRELGRAVKADEEILLDGHWTDALKRDVFESIEGLAKIVDDRVTKLTLGEIEEEEEDTEAF